jgi:hypothetical protein
MRVPTYHRKPAWQQFFAGMAIGGGISWCIFIYIYGVWQEEYSVTIKKQKDEITELNRDIRIWQEEFAALNKKSIEQLTVQDIKIRIVNTKKYELDLLSELQIEEGIKKDLSVMIAKDLETVYKSRDLLRRAIENKTVKVNNKRYRLEVKEIFIYTTLSIQLDIHLDG